MSSKNEQKTEQKQMSAQSLVVFIIIALMVGALILAGSGPTLLGMQDFVKDIGKEKIKNEDGTYSIPKDAPVSQNSDNRNTYIGRVLNEKIQYGTNDFFNQQLSYISSMQADPYTKYFYAKQVFEDSINRIIGMKKTQDMNLIISKIYLTKEIGKRYYSDSDGDIDYDAMKKDSITINQRVKELKTDLLFENFSYDYFSGLPVSKDEMFDLYKLENVKVSLKYINISNNAIDDSLLKTYFEQNKSNYKMYKLSKLIFKDKKEAEKSVVDIKKDPKNFNEVGRKLKLDQKIINIINDTDYSFVNDFENDNYKSVVKNTIAGNVGGSVIDTAQGPVIIKVEDIIDGDFSNEKVRSQVKNDYMIKNIKSIEENNKKLAADIYNDAKSSGLDKAATKYNLKIEKSASPVTFMNNGLPNINIDATEDRNFVVTIFKSNKGDVLSPFKYKDGYMIAILDEKTEVSIIDYEKMYDDLLKKYVSLKSRSIENDYYSEVRKKYEIINNFDYVITIQSFMPKEEQQVQ